MSYRYPLNDVGMVVYVSIKFNKKLDRYKWHGREIYYEVTYIEA